MGARPRARRTWRTCDPCRTLCCDEAEDSLSPDLNGAGETCLAASGLWPIRYKSPGPISAEGPGARSRKPETIRCLMHHNVRAPADRRPDELRSWERLPPMTWPSCRKYCGETEAPPNCWWNACGPSWDRLCVGDVGNLGGAPSLAFGQLEYRSQRILVFFRSDRLHPICIQTARVFVDQ